MNANLIITAAGVIVALFTRPDDRADRVEQQRLAKPAPLLRTIDREPPEHGRMKVMLISLAFLVLKL